MYSIAIVGAGVVGEASGHGLQRLGHQVTMFDADPGRVAQLRQLGYDAGPVAELNLANIDLVFVSVPTPTCNGRFIPFHLEEAARTIGEALESAPPDRYRVIIWRSTMLPGTTRQRLLPLLERHSGKLAGRNFGVAVHPEFLRAATSREDFMNPRSIVVGVEDSHSGRLLRELYAPFLAQGVEYVTFSSWEAAEFFKYVHNLLNAARISFFNEMRQAGLASGLEVQCIQSVFERVIRTAEAAWNPRYGLRHIGPFGGTCLPKDTQAFLQFAQEVGIPMPVLDGVVQVNHQMKELAMVPD